ncbi:MAG: RnfABCDGE type electron transport complex subunit D [Candidatus Aminicenantes bacterium]|nr:RnfABCDGE type electron transport complex subunit D [Candidatus Aminicenantes bacterium]
MKENVKIQSRPLVISSSPHILADTGIPQIMRNVIWALLPASFTAVYLFGLRALILIVICVSFSILTEFLFNIGRKKPVSLKDGSAVITGLLLALTLPPAFPPWAAAIGAIAAISLGKQVFGGLGYNIFNPALVGRAFLQAAFPVLITTWSAPRPFGAGTLDAITTATPLAVMKFQHQLTPNLKLFLGNVSGSLGETSVLALLIGAAFLFYKRIIGWRIPVAYLGTVVIVGGFFWLIMPEKCADPLFHLLSGGLILGAFFMATDMVTTPVTPTGRLVFGAGAGVLLVLIRNFGGLTEGVMYSILLMNGLTPLIDQYTRPKIFGSRTK